MAHFVSVTITVWVKVIFMKWVVSIISIDEINVQTAAVVGGAKYGHCYDGQAGSKAWIH
tara:strand:- start:29 stop:205 length:177 start_codon:yes stop_codon:yes gene_type:complete